MFRLTLPKLWRCLGATYVCRCCAKTLDHHNSSRDCRNRALIARHARMARNKLSAPAPA